MSRLNKEEKEKLSLTLVGYYFFFFFESLDLVFSIFTFDRFRSSYISVYVQSLCTGIVYCNRRNGKDHRCDWRVVIKTVFGINPG